MTKPDTGYDPGDWVTDPENDDYDGEREPIMLVVGISPDEADAHVLWEEPSGRTMTVAGFNPDHPGSDAVIQAVFKDTLDRKLDDDWMVSDIIESFKSGGEDALPVDVYAYPEGRIERLDDLCK
jgi:hypothetical protein